MSPLAYIYTHIHKHTHTDTHIPNVAVEWDTIYSLYSEGPEIKSNSHIYWESSWYFSIRTNNYWEIPSNQAKIAFLNNFLCDSYLIS